MAYFGIIVKCEYPQRRKKEESFNAFGERNDATHILFISTPTTQNGKTRKAFT